MGVGLAQMVAFFSSIFPLDIFSMSTRFSKQLSNKLGVIDQKSNKLGVFFNLFAYVPIK